MIHFNYTNLLFKVGTHMKKHFGKRELCRLRRTTTPKQTELKQSKGILLAFVSDLLFQTGRCRTPGCGKIDYTQTKLQKF